MSGFKILYMVTCILCTDVASYYQLHKLGAIEYSDLLRKAATKDVGQSAYMFLLAAGCLPQLRQTTLLASVRDVLQMSYHCCQARADGCMPPDANTPVTNACESTSFRAPCGKITLRTRGANGAA